jgi:hypothetical protein
LVQSSWARRLEDIEARTQRRPALAEGGAYRPLPNKPIKPALNIEARVDLDGFCIFL